MQEGEALITEFLLKVKKIPMGEMTGAQVLEEVAKLKADVLASDNPYVKDVLARGSWLTSLYLHAL